MRVVTLPLSSLPRAIKREEKRIEKSIGTAIRVTARKAVGPIKKRVPVAFGELRDSISPLDLGWEPKTGVLAPHAGSVERGSAPHTPNWDELLAWVKLRGMQGLTRRGRLRRQFNRAMGPTTPRQARRVATLFREREVRGKKGVGRHSPVNAPEMVARAISKSIEKHGTPPHFFVQESLPEIGEILKTELKRSIFRK